MFDWKYLGASWPTEQAYQALEILKQNCIRCRMPAEDMFFTNPFHLPRPDLRWKIQVRRRDAKHAMKLLAREGLAREPIGTEEPPAPAVQPVTCPSAPSETARSDPRRTAPAL